MSFFEVTKKFTPTDKYFKYTLGFTNNRTPNPNLIQSTINEFLQHYNLTSNNFLQSPTSFSLRLVQNGNLIGQLLYGHGVNPQIGQLNLANYNFNQLRCQLMLMCKESFIESTLKDRMERFINSISQSDCMYLLQRAYHSTAIPLLIDLANRPLDVINQDNVKYGDEVYRLDGNDHFIFNYTTLQAWFMTPSCNNPSLVGVPVTSIDKVVLISPTYQTRSKRKYPF